MDAIQSEININKVKWRGKIYNHYKDNQGMDVLESVDDDGFKTKIVFQGIVDTNETENKVVDLLVGRH